MKAEMCIAFQNGPARLSRVGEGGKLLGRPAASSLTFGDWIEG